jgi:hypothetical protein
VEDAERRFEEEKARIETEYREVLKNSVAFEKKMRNRWREKNREKNAQIANSNHASHSLKKNWKRYEQISRRM